MKRIPLLYISALAILFSACSPDQYCYRNDDCDDGMICSSTGACRYKCYKDIDCGSGFSCVNHACTLTGVDPTPVNPPIDNPPVDDPPVDDPPAEPVVIQKFVCPEGMSSIYDRYCIDKYEASRPDATDSNAGSDSSMATSRAGVYPWLVGTDNGAAEAACKAAGKRLCTPAEWEFSCHGVNNTVYGYGDDYDPLICNGLDTYGLSGFHLDVTGAYPGCTNGWDVYDMSGNLWEHTAGGSALTVRGGAFNCNDSESNHQCSYIPQTWTPLSIGFRCCSDGETVEIVIENDSQSDTPPEDENPQAFLFSPSFFNGYHREVLLAWNENDSTVMSDAGRGFYDADCISPNAAVEYAQEAWEYEDLQSNVIDVLKKAKSCNDDNTDITRALGIAYARTQNYPWALRTLRSLVSQNPDDCESLAWIAWIQIQMAMPDEASQTLESRNSCTSEALKARFDLIQAYQNMAENKPESAKRLIQNAAQASEMAESDIQALEYLQRATGIQADPNFTWKLEIDGGYASNALSGSPNDPSLMGKQLDSPFIDGEARFTLDPWKNAFTRAVVEGQFNGQYLTDDDTVDSSYIDISMRFGVVTDFSKVNIGVWYKPEMLFMFGDDKYDEGPLLFYTGHRLELDVEIMKWLYIFGGYGHRTFRQMVRTRDEFDIGAGGRHSLPAGFAITWGATYRQWLSTGAMYDLYGMNLSLALDYHHKRVDVRLNGSFSYDAYPDSKGYFESKEARNDIAARGTLQVWSPSWRGLRVGAQFKASRRWSSADDYDFQDYRGLIAVQWSGGIHFYEPHRIQDNAFALPWDFNSEGSAERIRDIIRQDEDMQRSSSCLQN